MRRNDKPILFHLTIGSPAEAHQMGSNNEQCFYKYQIMPEQISAGHIPGGTAL